jgi:hypothetical protein
MKKEGFNILAEQVGVKSAADGVKCIPDAFGQMPDGEYVFIEVKTNSGTLSPNQTHNYNALSRGEMVVPYGENAASGGLQLGVECSYRVLRVHVVNGAIESIYFHEEIRY